MSTTIAETLRSRAATDGTKPCVKFNGEWLSYQELNETSDRLAAGLKVLGVSPGDRVGLFLATRQEVVEMVFAIAKIGAVLVPCNVFLKGQFLEYQLLNSGATVMLVDAPGFDVARRILDKTSVRHLITVDDVDATTPVNVVPYRSLLSCELPPPRITRSPRDLAAILYTSGTTGLPKGCMLPDGYLLQLARAMRDTQWALPGDRIYTTNPIYHVSGLSAVLCALVHDLTVCFDPAFSASTFMARAKAEGATVVHGMGALAMAILAQPPSPLDAECSLRMALWTPLSTDLQAEFERRFNTPVIADAYGQTEVSPLATSSLTGPRKRNSSGRAVPFLEVTIVDDEDMELPVGSVGEIVVRPTSPSVMFFQGYWNDPEATVTSFRNLWHHTGDYGIVDEDGFITFVDRKKDSLRRRGENVSSFELEAAILKHPNVSQVAVTGVPSELGEDDIRASVVCRPGTVIEPESMFAFFRENLPYFTMPRYVDLRQALPINAVGRVMKHVLREEGLPPGAWDFEAMGLTVSRADRRR